VGGLQTLAAQKPYNPPQDYLNGLAWDGADHIRTLGNLLGLQKDLDYKKLRKFLIGAVARALKPGSKLDTMLVFCGEQGSGKSTFFRVLCPQEALFCDTLIDTTSRGEKMKLRGAWIVEVSELEAHRKAESTAFKNFLSNLVDEYRDPYGHALVRYPRHCVFAGTTNNPHFLQHISVGCDRIATMTKPTLKVLWAKGLQSFGQRRI
jgi:predicted P-loop ATPase